MLPALKPVDKPRVYDLLRQAGIDVSDWANYGRPDSPASNPKYCYNWSFEGADQIVLCLWYKDIRQHRGVLSQTLNYRTDNETHPHWTPVQHKRAREMNHAFQLADKKGIRVRVIVVDGLVGENIASEVQRRLLDPVPWFVASYDTNGDCRLQRCQPGDEPSGRLRRLARIAYNSEGWQRPTGEAGDQESGDTYNAQNGFGHEDWLFRAEWVMDGWRYAFLQGFNNNREACIGQTLDVTLFTIQPDKKRRLVATIYGLETLSDERAKDALRIFRREGWIKTMQDEVITINRKPAALGHPAWAKDVLNVRYRLENADMYPPDTFLHDDEWIRNRHRYQLYEFEKFHQERVQGFVAGRRGRQDAPEQRRLFRRGTKPVVYEPEHDKMQAKLMAELWNKYGKRYVSREMDFVDVRVETPDELIYFEIKTDLDPRSVMRQALGQLLEYAYHPRRTGRPPDSLVIVGRTALAQSDELYLNHLCDEFSLPLSYRMVTV